MAKLNDLVQDFLDQRKIAVVGVSAKRETGSNLAFRKFKAAGYEVYAVNPHISAFEGSPCFPDLKSLPEKPDGVLIFANPGVTDQIVEQCIDQGIKRIWMHCLLGTKPGLGAGMTSVSQEAIERARQNGISVIPGSCPNQYLNPDFGHSLMKTMCGALGFHTLASN